MSNDQIAVIVERIDGLKEHFNSKLSDIEKKLDGKCDACQHVPTFRERLRSQWFHITCLWAAVAMLAGAFYQHTAGK
ncbi:MAG: hypothetical protein N2491_01640 [Negativicutes bacterium]|nr:hypothetical protein [Negativicutes bacterium]